MDENALQDNDLDDVDKSMIPGAWEAYNKLVAEGKVPPCFYGPDENGHLTAYNRQ